MICKSYVPYPKSTSSKHGPRFRQVLRLQASTIFFPEGDRDLMLDKIFFRTSTIFLFLFKQQPKSVFFI